MRTKVIAGNWKMNKTLTETRDLVQQLVTLVGASPRSTVVICPPFPSLALASSLVEKSPIKVGGQNMSQHDEGAYTGEVSGKMLLAAGCTYVILGHSERRQYFSESDSLINAKAKKALALGLLPIICVGETLQEREGGIMSAVITKQVGGVLEGLTAEQMGKVIVAYEPVWAIGTGKNASPAQAQEVHALIRSLVTKQFGSAVASKLVIQYGGSVKPDNSAELLSQPDIDGALVGGACLKADSFSAIIASAAR